MNQCSRLHNVAIAVALSSLLPLSFAAAQGSVTYISDLNNPSGGFVAVASDARWAQSFRTGPNPLGYRLDSISLLMIHGTGLPSGFSVFLYDENTSLAVPASRLWTLSGNQNPSSAGLYSYTGSDIVLAPSTFYFVAAAASQPLTSGSYNWARLANDLVSIDTTGGWFLADLASSVDGVAWVRAVSPRFQLAISAAAIPEPSVYALLGLGGVFVITRGFRRLMA